MLVTTQRFEDLKSRSDYNDTYTRVYLDINSYSNDVTINIGDYRIKPLNNLIMKVVQFSIILWVTERLS